MSFCVDDMYNVKAQRPAGPRSGNLMDTIAGYNFFKAPNLNLRSDQASTRLK